MTVTLDTPFDGLTVKKMNEIVKKDGKLWKWLDEESSRCGDNDLKNNSLKRLVNQLVNVVNDFFFQAKQAIQEGKFSEEKTESVHLYCVGVSSTDSWDLYSKELTFAAKVSKFEPVRHIFETYLDCCFRPNLGDGVAVDISWNTNSRYIPHRKPVFKATTRPEDTCRASDEDLFKTTEFSNCAFVAAGGEKILVHRLMLMKVPYFQGRFSHGWEDNCSDESKALMKFEYSYKTMLEIKRYIYTGKVDTDYLKDCTNAIEMVRAASFFQIKALEEKGIAAIGETIDFQNFCEVVALQKFMTHPFLQKLCEWHEETHVREIEDVK